MPLTLIKILRVVTRVVRNPEVLVVRNGRWRDAPFVVKQAPALRFALSQAKVVFGLF